MFEKMYRKHGHLFYANAIFKLDCNKTVLYFMRSVYSSCICD
jgi:hypothetical protein